jgi:hypothetical protein
MDWRTDELDAEKTPKLDPDLDRFPLKSPSSSFSSVSRDPYSALLRFNRVDVDLCVIHVILLMLLLNRTVI